ncbi:hypothetical protein BKA69DRAFT_280994 [Paraphysoderma sedebokerense]|nr:hypothetical protein BKA69DRAFT_280994 [Paraphysoderma sedebokerense]
MASGAAKIQSSAILLKQLSQSMPEPQLNMSADQLIDRKIKVNPLSAAPSMENMNKYASGNMSGSPSISQNNPQQGSPTLAMNSYLPNGSIQPVQANYGYGSRPVSMNYVPSGTAYPVMNAYVVMQPYTSPPPSQTNQYIVPASPNFSLNGASPMQLIYSNSVNNIQAMIAPQTIPYSGSVSSLNQLQYANAPVDPNRDNSVISPPQMVSKSGSVSSLSQLQYPNDSVRSNRDSVIAPPQTVSKSGSASSLAQLHSNGFVGSNRDSVIAPAQSLSKSNSASSLNQLQYANNSVRSNRDHTVIAPPPHLAKSRSSSSLRNIASEGQKSMSKSQSLHKLAITNASTPKPSDK